MSPFTLQAITSIRVSQRIARHAIAAGAHRVAERFGREQTGQDVLEYTGVIVLIAGMFTILFTLNVPQNVCTAIVHAVNAIITNNHSYSAPPAIPDPGKS
jgi:hypothetical protein